ncbi:MAG: PPC domain-containing protein, partial [Gemmatimonadaceae bacterium]|nr:PPC domain-containing protein [Gemmatimonadaceae bacterium]
SAAPAPGSAAPRPTPTRRRGGEIRLSETITGALTLGSPVLDDSTRFDAWTFRGTQGQRVSITMRSSAFDPYLILTRAVDGRQQSVRQDDDGGGGTDARISIELPADGNYTIVANAVHKAALGDYTLAFESIARVQVTFAEAVRMADQHPRLEIGGTVRGSLTAESALLTDGSSFDAYSFEGRAGQVVEISMESTDFDAFLALGMAGSDSVVARDDDSGANSDALIVARLPRTGRYVILANSYGRDASGSYTLGIRTGLPTVATANVIGRAPTDRRIRIGQSVEGNLAEATEAMEDASPFQVWYFEGRAGQRVTLNLRSAEFDTYLHVAQVGGKQVLATDDDSGGGTNARITLALPANGMYAVVANALRPNGRGRYTLEMRDGSSIDWTAMTDRDVLAVADSFPALAAGQPVRGTLSARSPVRTDNTPFNGYVLQGRAGETVQIDMEASGFDAYLSIGIAGTDSIIGNDDDGGGGTNARLTVTFPRTGRYVVMANAIGKDARGDYTLRVGAGRAHVEIAEVLAARPAAPQMLRIGQTARGRLAESDPVLRDRTAFGTWFYEGRAGEQVTITMKSADFDAFLHLGVQGGTATLATDDDGAGGTDARITQILPRDGVYVIIANMLRPGSTGAYTLEVTSGGAPSGGAASGGGVAAATRSAMSNAAVLAMPVDPARRITVGTPVTGSLGADSCTLTDDSPFDAWYLEGRAGERVVITLRSSDFDAYVHIGRHGEQRLLANDDDSGGNTDSQLSFTFPANGTYVILANTFAAGASGRYRLEVSWASGSDDAAAGTK